MTTTAASTASPEVGDDAAPAATRDGTRPTTRRPRPTTTAAADTGPTTAPARPRRPRPTTTAATTMAAADTGPTTTPARHRRPRPTTTAATTTAAAATVGTTTAVAATVGTTTAATTERSIGRTRRSAKKAGSGPPSSCPFAWHRSGPLAAPVICSRNASTSERSSMSLWTGLPMPWPASVSMRMTIGASPAWAAWSAAANLNEWPGHDAVVVVAGGDQGRRIGDARADVVERRVGQRASRNCSGSCGEP